MPSDLLCKVRGFSRPDAQEPQTSEKRGLRYSLVRQLCPERLVLLRQFPLARGAAARERRRAVPSKAAVRTPPLQHLPIVPSSTEEGIQGW